MLPASLLSAVEAHPCFTGCYSHQLPVAMLTDPGPPVVSFHAGCQDCLMFHVGALASLLPPAMTQYALAQELSDHLRTLRGYRWAVSGYHATGPGFWLSAAYYGDCLFLVDGARNHGGKDVDLLLQAFKARIVLPDDPGMLDPSLYAADVVSLSCATPLGPIRGKVDLLRQPQCSPVLPPPQGYRRVCIVEYLPMTTAAAVVAQTTTAAPGAVVAAARPVLREGQVCPLCNAEVKERPLFSGTFVGCMC
jgi:hypothetical protein